MSALSSCVAKASQGVKRVSFAQMRVDVKPTNARKKTHKRIKNAKSHCKYCHFCPCVFFGNVAYREKKEVIP